MELIERDRGCKRDGAPLPSGKVSSELAKFAADFEAKILQPLREKRAVSDEILAIQPVPLGMVRNPELEGVADGEVCGLGVLAETVRTFLHWVPIKLGTNDALRLCVSCGDALAQEGEFACARDHFYRFVSETCEDIELERASKTGGSHGKSVEQAGARDRTSLTLEEACWAARAEFGLASMELRLTLARDSHVRFPTTLSRIIAQFRGIQRGMDLLLRLPKEKHDAASWLVLEGSILLLDWCDPLSVLGHGGKVAEFLVWAILAMECMVSLSTTKHLPWRTRLTAAACYAFEDAGKPDTAAKCAVHATEKVAELRRQEGMDPPIPPDVVETLDVAEADLRLLNFKYAALAAASAKHPAAAERNGNDGNGGDIGTARDGGADVTALTEADLGGLLDQHIPDVTERPVALVELLGRARGLIPGEACMICKTAVSLLLSTQTKEDPETKDGVTSKEEVAAGGSSGESNEGVTGKEQDSAVNQASFPLDVDQKMQLMREAYQLEDFRSWEAMIPLTKQHLKEAHASLHRDDRRAVWFEIALWTACKRLSTWRDKPEHQITSRGGMKRAPADATAKTPPSTSDGGTPTTAGVDGKVASGDGKGTDIAPISESDALRGNEAKVSVVEVGGGGGVPVVAGEEEEELRDALLPPRQAEVVEIFLDGASNARVRVNLTPLLAVIGLIRKALFGPYRHVLERRGDSVLEATMSVWEPYVSKILHALDGMPGEAEVDRSLLDALLLSLETIYSSLAVLSADDASLKATVALRLAILQADFRGDHSKACQTVRSALAGIDKHRQELTSYHLHIATTNPDRDQSVALARASVTASFHEHTSVARNGDTARLDNSIERENSEVGKNTASKLRKPEEVKDMGFHQLAALQLDITSTLFRVELLMGRDIAFQLATHQKAVAAAKIAARNNALKRRGNSNKVSKVTFGDSDGRFDTPVGSLALGWSVVLPSKTSAGNGMKALTGANAIVCAAGAGPLPSRTTRRRDIGFSLASAVEGLELPRGRGGETQVIVESCQATEARLVSEFRRNPYARAVLMATMARFRSDRNEQEKLLAEAAGLLHQARTTEKTLLSVLPPDAAYTAPCTTLPATPQGEQDQLQNDNKKNKTSIRRPPPPPFLLSRSHTSVEILPAPYLVSPSRQAKKRWQVGSGCASDGNTTLATNATSTKAATSIRKGEEPRERTRVAKVCVYGKPEGAGTGVALSNTRYAGLGIPIPYDPVTGICGAVSVRGLTPNESYVFAVAAFDETGGLIGGGIGKACTPVETLNPLPLSLCWANVSRIAVGLGCPSVAGQAAKEVYQELIASAAVNQSPGTRGEGIQVQSDSKGTGVATNLCEGWMASPLHSQAFNPKALDRCPRGILQAFIQASFVLVDTTDDDGMSKASSSEDAPLEEQICRLISLKRLSLACEAAVLLQDWDLVSRGVWRAYHLLLPLLRVMAIGHVIFQILCQLHQCLSMVPKDGWDGAIKATFACLAYQITLKGHEIGENPAAVKTLLENSLEPELSAPENTVFKDKLLSKEGEEGSTEEEGVPQQKALLEVWVGLAGYGKEHEAASRLRKALNLNVSVAQSPSGEAGEGVRGDEQKVLASSVSPLEAMERLMIVAHGDPTKAWKLLSERLFVSHPERAGLMCRVCRIALGRGMAQEVISWLEPSLEGTNKAGNTGSAGAESSYPSLAFFAASDLEPLTTKVLEREGTLKTLRYISPAVSKAVEVDSVARNETAGVDQTSDEANINGAEEAGLVEGSSATTDHCSSHGGLARNAAQDDMGAFHPTPSEVFQLLWLSEAENILGASFLQLAFSAARTLGSGPHPLNEVTPTTTYQPSASKPTVAAVSVMAAGGRRPWGYSSGPFAEVSAMAPELFGIDSVGARGEEEGSNDAHTDEGYTVNQLEDEGASWPVDGDVFTSAGDRQADPDSGKDKQVVESDNKDAALACSLSAKEDLAFSAILSKAMLHLTRAASRATWGRLWVKTEGACGLMWNAILSLWLSPQDFKVAESARVTGQARTEWRVSLREYDARVYAKACEALLDAVDAVHNSQKNNTYGEGGDGSGGSAEGSEEESTGSKYGQGDEENDEGAVDVGTGGREEGVDTTGALDVRWVSRFVEWGLQGILRCRCWGVVVKVGTRLMASTGGLYGGHRVYPLVLFAQKRLCSLASGLLSRREARLSALDEGFQAAQAKRRRRKVLKAVETKSKEEIEHERGREPLVEAVGDARVRKQIHDHRLGTVLQSRDSYIKTKKIGRRSLDDAREALAEYLALLPSMAPEIRDGGTQESGTTTLIPRGENPEGFEKELKTVLKLYGRAVEVLREKRERELLTESLCDLGDLYVLRERYDMAAKSWTDAIDGLCSTLDSVMQWRLVFEKIRAAHPSSGGPPGGGGSLALALGGRGCFAGGTVLGKLSIFTSQTNMDGQLNMCLMAAEMFRAPLEISLPFPQRACDYASYTPESLGGFGSEGLGLWTDDRSLSASAFYSSLMHIQEVLTTSGRIKEALPILAILEHVASRVTLDPLQLARVRLARVECLAGGGFPAEAASALAAVLTGGGTPKTTGDYAGRRCRLEKVPEPPPTPGKGVDKEKKGKDKKGQPSQKSTNDETPPSDSDSKPASKDSGLFFYGLAPYHNGLPLDHPDNAAAVRWLSGEEEIPAESLKGDGTEGNPAPISRHVRLMKRGLFGMDPTLIELHGENEACLVARARARLLLVLADCSALPVVGSDPTVLEGGTGTGAGDGVLRRVRDAADSILGEILQVIMKRISPTSIAKTSASPPDSSRSGKSQAPASSQGGSLSNEKKLAAAATAAKHIAATAPGKADGWAPPMAADALLLRGRLALLDGKLRVCRHHASRGLAVLLRHGVGSCAPSADVASRIMEISSTNDGSNVQGNIEKGACITFGDEQSQPWRVVQTWLGLRHDLAAVALLQGRTQDANSQIEKGLREAQAVGEVVISRRLRRIKAQAAVAEGELEQAVIGCRILSSEYLSDGAFAMDHAAVLRLLAKVRRQQSLVCGRCGDRTQTLLLLSESRKALRLANLVLLNEAKGLGWIGTGLLTYTRPKDNVMMADAQPHLLHALGTSFRDLPTELPEDFAFGLAPADEVDDVAPSPLANLYLPMLRLLLSVRVSLLDVVEGIGHHNPAGEASGETSQDGKEPNGEDIGETGTVGMPERGAEHDWLAAASGIAEETAALLRHVANPHPAERAQILLLVGKLRLRRLQSIWGSSIPPKDPGRVGLADGIFKSTLEEATRSALTAALTVSFKRGGHDWRVMGDACMGLVFLYATSCGIGELNTGSQASEADEYSKDGGQGDAANGLQLNLKLASHYLRLAASMSSCHHRLDVELESIAVDPLPTAVVDSMPRSALDELAGRGGREPEDDPLLLSARGLLQFLRARKREKCLAAAPADLLAASVICQIHALLYEHAPVYREKCCVSEGCLAPTSHEILDVPPGEVCVQWVWDNVHDAEGVASAGAALGNGQGLHPMRTAFVLLGTPAVGDEDHDGTNGSSSGLHPPPIAMSRVTASRAEDLRRRASQLKGLFAAFKKKSPAAESVPSSLQERFQALLKDTAYTLRAGLVTVPLSGALATTNLAIAPDVVDAKVTTLKLSETSIRVIEGVFDTEIGVDMENEEICRFLSFSTRIDGSGI